MLGLIVCAGLLLGAADSAQAAGQGHSSRGCFNCHVPHQANPVSATDYGVPLWSPAYTQDGLKYTYVMYSSPTFDALSPEKSAQPDGSSKLCLGCHDGSYDHVTNPKRIFTANSLSTTHPISFKYTAALAAARGPALRSPTESSGLGGTIAQDLLDSQSKMQCTSCHDVHSSGNGTYMLRWAGIDGDPLDMSGTGTFVKGSELPMCKTCHNK
jgi:Zn-finger protein